MKIGLKIRLLRHKADLDQYQLATLLNLSIADYSRIENGLYKLNTTILEELIQVFGLTKEEFFSWQHPEKDCGL